MLLNLKSSSVPFLAPAFTATILIACSIAFADSSTKPSSEVTKSKSTAPSASVSVSSASSAPKENQTKSGDSAPAKPKPATVPCKTFVQNTLNKSNFTCRFLGRYQTTDIDQSDVSTAISATKGTEWKTENARGVETAISATAGLYTVELFKLNPAPVKAQASDDLQTDISEVCTAETMRIVTRIREPGEAWSKPYETNVKRSKSGFSAAVSQPDLRLKINCN